MPFRTPFQRLVCALFLCGLWGCVETPPTPAEVEQALLQKRSDERSLVQATISDAERARQFIELLDERDRLVASQRLVVEQFRRALLELMSDYDASTSDFDRLLSDYNGRRRQWQEHFIAVIEGMQKTTTASEWKQIARFQITELNPREQVFEARDN